MAALITAFKTKLLDLTNKTSKKNDPNNDKAPLVFNTTLPTKRQEARKQFNNETLTSPLNSNRSSHSERDSFPPASGRNSFPDYEPAIFTLELENDPYSPKQRPDPIENFEKTPASSLTSSSHSEPNLSYETHNAPDPWADNWSWSDGKNSSPEHSPLPSNS